MKTQFRIGTHFFHDEQNMNYTANRVYAVNGGDLQEIKSAVSAIGSLADWKRAFLNLAGKALDEKRTLHASAYYRAANFYISPDDPDKQVSYDAYVGLVHELYKDEFETGIIQEIKIPYEKGFLAAWHIEPGISAGERNVVVMHLGFDSLKEEMIPVIELFREAGLELVLFEGPGQGETLWKYDIRMTHEYEKPVKAVLDYFNLEDVTLVGLSLGGYLAPRAGAYEPRVKRVVAWGVMYDFFETVLTRRGKWFEVLCKTLLAFKAPAVLNAVVGLKIKTDTYARWGIEHGMHVLGAGNPYEYFEKLRLYSMKNISHLVRQDFLLLSSTRDHFIPGDHFCKQARALVNVRSFTGRIFTEHEHAENHVSFGNTPLVVQFMINWIREHTSGKQR